MKKFFTILLLLFPAMLASAQTYKDVLVDTSGNLVAPVNLWTANSGNISIALGLGNYVLSTRSIIAGTGLTGGGDLSANRTLSLANTAVTAGVYGGDNKTLTMTVDAQGRLTSAANKTITPTGIGAVPSSLSISTGTGLTGGGDLSANRTLSLTNTAVTAGVYGGNDTAVSLTVDAQGRLTSVSNKTITVSGLGAVPSTRTITAGTGLTGGGDLSANRTLSLANTSVTAGVYGGDNKTLTVTVDAQGRLTSAVNATITPSGIGALGNTGNQTLTGNLTVNGNGSLNGSWTYKGNATVEGSSAYPGYAQNAVTAREVVAPYAVIFIPLPPGSAWTDFELKASINNFTDDVTGLKFFYHSPDPGKSVITQQVWTNRPQVYFTDSGKTGTPNQRAWIKQNATNSIFAMLVDNRSEVGGIIVVIKDNLSQYRDSLVWSYSLMDAATINKDLMDRDVWKPIWPSQWVWSFAPPGT